MAVDLALAHDLRTFVVILVFHFRAGVDTHFLHLFRVAAVPFFLLFDLRCVAFVVDGFRVHYFVIPGLRANAVGAILAGAPSK